MADENRKWFLDRASEIVTKDRNKSYGEPEDNFNGIAQMWSVYLRNKGKLLFGREISSEDVAVMMALLKIQRASTGEYNADNYVDCIGYMACAGQCAALSKPKEDEVFACYGDHKKE
jgi:hypothetical protein